MRGDGGWGNYLYDYWTLVLKDISQYSPSTIIKIHAKKGEVESGYVKVEGVPVLTTHLILPCGWVNI